MGKIVGNKARVGNKELVERNAPVTRIRGCAGRWWFV